MKAYLNKKDGYTRKEVSKLLEISSSSIQMYTDRGIIVPRISNPTGRGTVRRYSDDNLFEFLVLKELQKFGVPLKHIETIIKKLGLSTMFMELQKNLKGRNKTCLLIYNFDSEKFTCMIGAYNPNVSEITLHLERGDSVLIIELSRLFEKAGLM